MTLAGTRSTPINATVVETRLYSWNMDTDPRPVRHCLCAENKADSGTVDLWNSADLCDYQRCTDPVRGSVCTVSHRHRLDGCFFPRGDRLFAPMGLFGVRVVRQPHYAVGRIPWNTGIYKGAWKALPGAKVHHDGHLDHGDSYFCG